MKKFNNGYNKVMQDPQGGLKLVRVEEVTPTENTNLFADINLDKLMCLVADASPKVFIFLVQNMNRDNITICSYSVLEECLNISTATVSRTLKWLKDNGFISITKDGTSNIYTINKEVVSSKRSKKK